MGICSLWTCPGLGRFSGGVSRALDVVMEVVQAGEPIRDCHAAFGGRWGIAERPVQGLNFLGDRFDGHIIPLRSAFVQYTRQSAELLIVPAQQVCQSPATRLICPMKRL